MEEILSFVNRYILTLSFVFIYTTQIQEWMTILHIIWYQKGRLVEEIMYDTGKSIDHRGKKNRYKVCELCLFWSFHLLNFVYFVLITYLTILNIFAGEGWWGGWFDFGILIFNAAVLTIVFIFLFTMMYKYHRFEFRESKNSILLFFFLMVVYLSYFLFIATP